MTLSDEIEISDALIILDRDTTIGEYRIVVDLIDRHYGIVVSITRVKVMLKSVRAAVLDQTETMLEGGLMDRVSLLMIEMERLREFRARTKETVERPGSYLTQPKKAV